MANNMANALTPGFKATRPVYNGSVLDASIDSNQVPQTYVNIPSTYVHFSDGPLMSTGNSLDLAIEGPGFFVVSTPNGTMYTRDGQFKINQSKQLATIDGYPVEGQNGGPITVSGNVKVESDGSVYVDGSRVDKVKVSDFSDTTYLKSFGKSLFVNAGTNNTEKDASNFSIKGGAYEGSNVDTMKEMVEMITAMRAYEAYTKADQAVDDSLGKLLDTAKM